MTLPQPVQASIDGRVLSWREAGSGPAMILVHGIGTDSRLWKEQFQAFAARYRVVAWDAPGYGASGSFATPTPTKTDYASALGSLLHHLGITAPHIVGHSLGAVMVAALCKQGFLPASVTLLHPLVGAGRMDPAKREQLRQARIEDMRGLGPKAFANARGRAIIGKTASPERIQNAIDNMSEVTAEGYIQAWEMMCSVNLFDDIDAIRAPTQILCGGDDPVAPVQSCREIAARIPGSSFHVFEGVGHSLPAENSEILNKTLLEFLD